MRRFFFFLEYCSKMLPLLVVMLIISTVVTSSYCQNTCEGSVIVYYTEKGQDRIDNMRNWGVLEEKLEEDKYKRFKKYFNPATAYAYTVEGDCCWEIYNKEFFRKPSHKLKVGFHGIPNFPQFNINSMKKVPC